MDSQASSTVLKIQGLYQSITKNSLLNGVLLIGGGTAISQAIGVLAMVVIAHIYSPADFGLYAVYISFLSIISFSSFKYEMAVPLPDDDHKAANLLVFCLVLTAIVSLLLAIVAIFFGDEILTMIGMHELTPYLLILFVGFLGMNLYQILNYWAIRKRDYARITYTKFNQAIGGALGKIVLGLLSFSTWGLLIGDLISRVSGIGTFFTLIFKQDLGAFKKITIKEQVATAKEYYKFPLYTFSAAIINTIAIQIPTLIIFAVYSSTEAGYYSLASSILAIPMSLIGGSIAQAYLGEIAVMVRDDPQKLESTYKSITYKLLLISVPIIVCITLAAQFLFPVIFGSKWTDASAYCLPLSLIAISYMAISPTSYLEVYGLNDWVLIWDIVRTVLILAGFYLGVFFNVTPVHNILIYSIILMSMYIVNYYMNIIGIRRFNRSRKA